MGVDSLGDAFAEIMKRHGWSAAALSRHIGASQPWVSMVLAGKRDPGMAKSAGLLRTVGWTLELIPAEEEPVKRRRFLASAASVALIPSATSTNPYRDAAYVRLLADRLALTEDQIGGAPLVPEALRHLARITPAVHSGDTALQSAASALARRAALILHDTRDRDRAAHAAGFAVTLAKHAGDATGQAHGYATLSLIRNYDGPRSRAAEYVRRGLALEDLEDSTRAELLVRFARSLAGVRGQERAVRRALEEAQGLADGLSPVDGAEVMANSGIALVDCGLHSLGAADLQAAIASVQSQSPLLVGLYRARLTKSAIQAGDVGGMVGGMDALAMVAPLLTSRRMDIHVRHILGDTHRWAAVREIRHAREQLREVAS